MKYVHDRILQKALPLKLTETLNALTLVRCFKLSFYYIRPMCRVVNERSYCLIEMNIKKALQASAFSFLVLNLVEKVVLHYFGLYKSALGNKQLITSNVDTLKGKSSKH